MEGEIGEELGKPCPRKTEGHLVMDDMAWFMNRQHIEEGRKIDTSVRTSVDFFGPFQRLSRFFPYHANESLPEICGLTCDDEVPCSEMRHPVHLGPRSTGPVCDREYQ